MRGREAVAVAARDLGYPGDDVAVKPLESSGSRGFRVLSSSADALQELLTNRPGVAPAMQLEDLLALLPEDGGPDSVEVQTHAWLEALLPGTGGRGEPVWVVADPTNRRLAGETHVKIGHGRRYSDVPPIKGVYRGAAGAELEASVRMTRLDPAASARA